MLRDVSFNLNPKGEAVEKVKFLNAARNFPFAFAVYAKLMGFDLKLETGVMNGNVLAS